MCCWQNVCVHVVLNYGFTLRDDDQLYSSLGMPNGEFHVS